MSNKRKLVDWEPGTCPICRKDYGSCFAHREYIENIKKLSKKQMTRVVIDRMKYGTQHDESPTMNDPHMWEYEEAPVNERELRLGIRVVCIMCKETRDIWDDGEVEVIRRGREGIK